MKYHRIKIHNEMKKFLIILLVEFICIFIAVAHAEEVDPYFAWEIKNIDDYQLPNASIDVRERRDDIYKLINKGEYFDAANNCRIVEVYQKVMFNINYFDEGLTELVAKLYLEADELDAATHKINFLLENTRDISAKIRALNLQSDLYNRLGSYHKALYVTEEVAKLLESAPDEKLSLINQMRAARAYCGLGEIEKSLELAEKIFPLMQNAFGKDNFQTLALMSILAEDYRKTQRYEDCTKILSDKVTIINERYGKDMPGAMTETVLEIADLHFSFNDTKNGEEMMMVALSLAEDCEEESKIFVARQLYKGINRVASKYLDENHPLVLKSEVGQAYASSAVFGDVSQAIASYKKSLPKFKKVFGEDNYETLDLMNALSDAYLSLGKYSDAKKIIEERLSICKKYFGNHNKRTIQSTIDLADVYYKIGKYKTADKLLDDIQAQNVDLFEESPTPEFAYKLSFVKAVGARMRGDFKNFSKYLNEVENLFKHDGKAPYDFSDYKAVHFILESLKQVAMLDIARKPDNLILVIISLSNMGGSEHDPEVLKLNNDIAEYYIAYGELKEAERYANQILRLSRTHLGKDNFYEWMALNTLSKIRRAEGNFTNALELDNQALKIAEKVCGKKSLERFQSLNAIASDHAGLGNFNEAIKIRERTLAEYKKILEDSDAATNQMMTNLAENYLATKRYDDAIKLCDETFALQKVPWYYDSHISFYPCVTELIRIKAQARKLSGDDTMSNVNYGNLIGAYEFKRMYLNERDAYDDESKSRWFAEILPDYKDAAAVAASDKVGAAKFAFYCMELCKGRNLIDRYNDVLIAKDYVLTPSEKGSLAAYEKFMANSRAVSEYAKATNDGNLFLNSEYLRWYLSINTREFTKELREKYSTNMKPKNSHEESNIWQGEELLKNFDVKKNQAAIPDGACLIEFMKTSDDSLLVTFLRNEGDVQAVNIPVDKKFFDDCQLYHELNSYADIKSLNYHEKFLWKIKGEYKLTTRREKTTPDEVRKNDDENLNAFRQEISAELSAKLMPTLERFAGNSKHWIISPDAELNLLPFETFIYHDKLLIESKDVSYVPSLAVMNLMRNRERKNSYLGREKELFAMGNAIYGNSPPTEVRGSQLRFKFGDLPGTAQELDKVSRLFERKAVFRREQASEKNLREMNASGELSKYKYLLFAAHGVFIPEKPQYSSIVLSQQFNDEDNDGYVTVGEWMGYDLRSNLIYLSACESGRGGYQAGEGIVGIPYALTVAGNKDTVMSLWKVNDTATAEFTSAVFEKLSRGQSEVSALNETKREFLKQDNPLYRSPSVWAAFLLYGI